jgi:hypothetical protein
MQRKIESSAREEQVRNESQTSPEMFMKPVPETVSTLTEGVGLVKPRGLSRMVMIAFPFK